MFLAMRAGVAAGTEVVQLNSFARRKAAADAASTPVQPGSETLSVSATVVFTIR